MNKKLILSFLIIFFCTSEVLAGSDPFSRSFTKQSKQQTIVVDTFNDASDGSETIDPMLRYDLSKYFVKGVVITVKESLAIISYPGGIDRILYKGDPIGNDMYTIKEIQVDYVVAGKKNREDFAIDVLNPVRTTSSTTSGN